MLGQPGGSFADGVVSTGQLRPWLSRQRRRLLGGRIGSLGQPITQAVHGNTPRCARGTRCVAAEAYLAQRQLLGRQARESMRALSISGMPGRRVPLPTEGPERRQRSRSAWTMAPRSQAKTRKIALCGNNAARSRRRRPPSTLVDRPNRSSARAANPQLRPVPKGQHTEPRGSSHGQARRPRRPRPGFR